MQTDTPDSGLPAGFRRPARLVDIAKKSGYSIKTVSRVLNSEQYVSEDARKRVWEVVDELGYVVDNRARTLRTNKSGYVGLIVPDIRNGFFASLANAVEKRLGGAGNTLLLGISDELATKEEQYLRVFQRNRIDNLIVVPSGSDALKSYATQVPTVILDRTQPGLAEIADHVTANNREAAKALTSHLIERHGLKTVVMIAGEKQISSVLDRQLGYRDAMAAAGLEPIISDGHLSPSEAEAGALQVMRRLPKPFGVFATGSRMYWGAMSAVANLGLTIPRDVAITTFDGSGTLNVAGLTPTQAILPVQTMVARTFQFLAERNQDPSLPVRHLSIDSDIEYGFTCGCVDSSMSGPLVVRTGP